ncbi:MAG: hypothetical protein HY898_35210 [Deltaproteobacteria bacterium]|nr:hypothetical protein [Deltaproteobacteria bacterium]
MRGTIRQASQRTSKVLGIILLLALVLKVGCVLVMRTDGSKLARGQERSDLIPRRDYLQHRLQGSFEHQAMTPGGDLFLGEWALGALSMTSAATANLAFTFPDTRAEAPERIALLIERAMQGEARAFDQRQWGEDPLETLHTDQGHLGYLGHFNLMLGAYRAVGGDHRYDALHRKITHAMVRRMDRSVSAHVETYRGEIYTSDNTTAAASIAVYDLVSGENHRPSLERYVAYMRAHLLDERTGLVVFKVDGEGRPLGAPRGCGVGWNSFYLPFVDEAFATEQYARIKDHMVKRLWFGMVGIREYPVGVPGWGDVDSGPVLLELSTSGTGFAMAGAKRAGDGKLLGELLDTGEIVGTSIQWSGRRRYLLAPLVGDAIVLAMKTATRWDDRYLARP